MHTVAPHPRFRSFARLRRFSLLVIILGWCLSPTWRLRGQADDSSGNPTGNSGDFNGEVSTAGSYDPFTGNAKRSVTDLVVPGTAGVYPLAFSRTANSRFTATPPDDAYLGDGGGWRHSYQWALFYNGSLTDTSGATYRTWAVAYPDGRVVSFRKGHQYAPAGETFLRGPAGVSDRLETDNPESATPGYFILHLADGGQVKFFGGIGQGRYRATEITDPLNQLTRLDYDPSQSNPYLLYRVTEPAGHYIQFYYDTYSYNGKPWVVLGKVQGYTPYGSSVSDVGYTYDAFGNSGVNNNTPYLVLTNVFYYSEPSNDSPGPGNVVRSRYYYGANGNVNSGYRPLLQACQDYHFSGAMANIAYTYNTGTGQPWGCVQLESRALANGVTAETVSQLYGPGGDPTEVRGDGPQRNFHYGQGGTTGFTETYAKPYQITTATDFQGQATYYAYNSKFVPANSTQPNPAGFAYRNAVKDRRGNVTNFDTEPVLGQTLKVTYPPEPDGSRATRTFAYEDPANPYYLRAVTDERNQTTTYTRDGNHLVRRIDYPDQSFETFDYETVNIGHGPFQRLTGQTTRRGARITYAYNDGYRTALPTSVSHPFDNDNNVTVSTTFEYDNSDRVACSRDERNQPTWFAYNSRHQLTRLTHADNTYVDHGYDDYGNQTSVTNELGKTWRTSYDEYRRVNFQTDPLNHTVALDYIRSGQSSAYLHATANPSRITPPSGHAVGQVYSDNWWLIQSLAGAGSSDQLVTTFGYDAEGRRTSVTDPSNYSQSWTFDARGRPATATDALGHVVTRAYYPPGHPFAGLPSYVDAPGRTPGEILRTDFLDYDPWGQLKQQRDPAGQVVTRQYDYAGALRFLSDANGTNTFGYDLLGRLGYLSFPDGTYEGYHRDAAGNTDGFHNRAGQQRTTWYDARNRPYLAQWANGAGSDVAWGYDNAGQLKDFNNWFSALHFEYDDAGRSLNETASVAGSSAARTTSYHPNDDGIVDQLIYPGGSAPSWALNGRNQFYGLNGLSYYGFYPNGWQSMRLFANGTVAYFGYDVAGRITATNTQRYTPSYQNISYRSYGYAPNGQMTWFYRSNDGAGSTENNNGDAYVYRRDGALKTVYQEAQPVWTTPDAHGDSVPAAPSTVQSLNAYSYDLAGNRTQASYNAGATVEDFAVDGENRLSAVAGQPVTPDADSNIADARGWHYTFDADNQLRSADGPGGRHQEFIYDAAGRLARRIENNVGTFYYYYAGAQLVEERDYAGNPLYNYFHDTPGADSLLCRQDAATGALLWYHYDARGQVSHLSDGNGNVVEKYLYDAFGQPKVLDAAGNPRPGGSLYHNRHLFSAGYEWLEGMGVFHCGARFYRPDLGRWLSPDPAGFAASGTNLYAYCGNDPVNGKDPSGMIVVANTGPLQTQTNTPPLGPQWSRPLTGSSIPGASSGSPTSIIPGPSFSFGISDFYDHGSRAGNSASSVSELASRQWGNGVFLGTTTLEGNAKEVLPIIDLLNNQLNSNHFFTLNDMTLKAEMMRVYLNKVLPADIPHESEFQFEKTMASLDTDFRYRMNDADIYYSGSISDVNNKTYKGYEVNYVGVGEGFAARNRSVIGMNIDIVGWSFAQGYGWPTSGKFQWAKVGYDWYKNNVGN